MTIVLVGLAVLLSANLMLLLVLVLRYRRENRRSS